jgi:hypothetical protein
MRLSQSHPLQPCIVEASWHIVVSSPSVQDFHRAVVQVAFPVGDIKLNQSTINNFEINILIGYASVYKERHAD